MTCEELRRQVLAYLEHQLAPAESSAFEHHAQDCPSCGRFLAIARETTCRHVVEFLSEYIERTLPAAEAEVFERHMALCPPCVDYLSALRSTMEAGRTCSGGVLPEIPEELVKAILMARPR